MKRKLQVAGLMLTMVVALAACSSNPKSASTTTSTTASSATTASTPTTSAPTTSTTKAGPTMTITPSTGLTNNEVVTITGSGFPVEQLGVTECANKGNQTGAGDCNLGGIKVTTPSADGTVSYKFTVALGPFGANHIVCTNAPGCIVSLAQAGSADPNVTATATIKFG
jgi:ABC-type Fe3+-hydroxamate transport system substrate-binding protein